MRKTKRKMIFVGSFTVEASLLMLLLLPVVLSVLYAAFYVHDKALLQGIACETAVMGSNLSEEADTESRLNKLEKQLITSRLLWTKNVGAGCSLGSSQSAANVQGEFHIPGMLVKLFGGNVFVIQQDWTRELFHPAKTIRKIRGLEYLAEVMEG